VRSARGDTLLSLRLVFPEGTKRTPTLLPGASNNSRLCFSYKIKKTHNKEHNFCHLFLK